MIEKAGIWIVAAVAAYFSILFVIPFLIFPNLLFKTKIQKSEKLREFSKKFIRNSKEKTLLATYEFLSRNFKGEEEKYRLFLNPWKHFFTNTEKIIKKRQFLPCHVQNLTLITLLINTGKFTERDFERKETMTIWGTIHQYIIVTIAEKRFKADPFFKILNRV